MRTQYLFTLAAFAITCLAASAQTRKAAMVGGGNPDRGKCTAEIVVDGAAAVEIQGTTATLRDVSGQPPQWRRFECTSPLPMNPGEVHFSALRGRGRLEMVRDPRNGGVASIRIEDPESGSDVYAFELSWSNRGGYPERREEPRVDRERDDHDREAHGRFTMDEAIHSCQDAIRSQAAERFRDRAIEFRRTAVDKSRGRGDWVTGRFAARRFDAEDIFQFSCSVDWDGRRVREAHFEPLGR